jgi:hypothetical protein
VSRTDPLVDAVREPGAKDTEAKPAAPCSATRGHVRVVFPRCQTTLTAGHGASISGAATLRTAANGKRLTGSTSTPCSRT